MDAKTKAEYDRIKVTAEKAYQKAIAPAEKAYQEKTIFGKRRKEG